MRYARVEAALLAIMTLAGCSATLTGDDLLMCNAARFLATSIAITDETLVVGVDERPEQAAERAVQALGLAEGASRALNEVGEATQAEPVWQHLIRSYRHAADAASSLIPDFRQHGGVGDESLRAARGALDDARLGLPPSCFAVSAN